MPSPTYAGTPEHRAVLRAITEQYADDPRMLAVAVFGSLGRGTWDAYSDLDLDVVTVDGLKIDAQEEVRRLCRVIGQEPVVVLPFGEDAADVVLASLLELSIRYHPLASTSPNIVESLQVLTGRIDPAIIVAAGLANRRRPPDLSELVGACVRHAVTTDAKLHRRAFWLAYPVVHDLRDAIIRLFAATHGNRRPYQAVHAAADEYLRERLGRTLPGADLPSLQRSFLASLDLLEHDLDAVGAGQIRLTEGQQHVLAQLRERQARLDQATRQ